MGKQKDFNNPDMKEIFFEGTKTQSNTVKAKSSSKKSKDHQVGESAGQSSRNQPSQKKRGLFCLSKKNAALTSAPVVKDPLDDLELIDLMDDDALERLAEKDWARYMEIATKQGAVVKDPKALSKVTVKEKVTSVRGIKPEAGKTKAAVLDTGSVVNKNKAQTTTQKAESTKQKKNSDEGQVPSKTVFAKASAGQKDPEKTASAMSSPVNNRSAGNTPVRNVSVRASSVKRGYTSFSRIKISMVAITLLICVLAGIVANRMLVIKQRSDVLASFVGIGSGLAEVNVIGQQGLNAVSEGHRQALAEEERKKQEKEKAEKEALEEKDRVQVELVCQTIMGDLKIKFINNETNRVIAGVPFCAEVTGPDGKVTKYTNEDKDGIIYLSPMPAGEYTITMGDVPTGEKYKKYMKATKSGYVAVSDTINYKVVDVTDEVVPEAEAAGEQKVVNDVVEENVLQDTVAFVESTKKLISGGESYTEIGKDQIKIPESPQTRGFISGNFVFMADDTSDTGESKTVGDPPKTEVPNTGATGGSSTTDSSDTSGSNDGSTGSASTGTSGADASSGAQTPEKTYTARVDTYQSVMKTGETATVTTSTNLNRPSYKWFVSDGSAETVSFTDGASTCTVTAKKAGSVTLMCHVSGEADDGSQIAAIPVSCTITVEQGEASAPEINPSQKITTKDNQLVYVQDASGKYIEATYGDYQANKKLYVRSDEKAVYEYTGWQVINGATYYYTADKKFVTGEHVIGGVKYNFSADGVLQTGNTNTGIDVSAHQGAIDWAAVKSAGVSFAIIRVGFRGYGTGRLVEDSCFRQNIRGAVNNGIRVGVYVFSAAVNEAEAVEEASLAINLIRGYNITYPVYIDIESSGTGSGRADNIDVATRTAVAQAFCQTVANAGYKPGVYANTTWFNSYMNTPQLTGYSLWLAQYNTTVTYKRTKYDIWQYTSKGSIPGINTRVDMNIGYTTY